MLLLLATFASACANRVTLTGGPQDTTPPQLDTLHSTPNYQTFFKKQDIVLAFDEWVELKDVFNQVVVSPPLQKRPTIQRRKKSIIFRFDDEEVLRDSATYVINFGNAIVDITEGNPAPIVFVFSTGPYIDSLWVAGRVLDALTGAPVENTLVMLYENPDDSVVYRERPFYFARTDKDGRFRINNVRQGRFKTVALADQNLNYRYDGESERIGFIDSLISVAPPPTPTLPDSLLRDSLPADSLQPPLTPPAPPLTIRLFQEQARLLIRERQTTQYGQVVIVFNQAPPMPEVQVQNVGQLLYTEQRNDTLRIWYHTPIDTSWRLYLRVDTLLADTLTIPAGRRDNFLASAKVATSRPRSQTPPTIHPDSSFTLTFDAPLLTLHDSLLLLRDDSTGQSLPAKGTFEGSASRRLRIAAKWIPSHSYTVVLLPGALTNLYGATLQDTLQSAFKVGHREDFGNLTLHLVGLDSAISYVLHLIDPEKRTVARYQLEGVREFDLSLQGLKPAVYEVELIEDLDRNGHWSTGNYLQHRQPERIFRRKLEQLRANWELDVRIEVDFDDASPAPNR